MAQLMRRLGSSSDRDAAVPRGCMPVLVCPDDGAHAGERFVVRVEALAHPSFVALLETAAQEFGYRQEGVLRLPCGVQHFRQVLHSVAARKNDV